MGDVVLMGCWGGGDAERPVKFEGFGVGGREGEAFQQTSADFAAYRTNYARLGLPEGEREMCAAAGAEKVAP
jgi:hypothetical protein